MYYWLWFVVPYWGFMFCALTSPWVSFDNCVGITNTFSYNKKGYMWLKRY
jgi:hypothetical protein